MEVKKDLNIIITLAISFVVFFFFLIGGLSWSGPSYRAKDHVIVQSISRAQIVMYSICDDEGSCDDFNCVHEEVLPFCRDIDKYYGSEDNKEPIVAHDALDNSQAACIYSPLNREEGWFRKKHFWYCADSKGNAGYTKIDPGSNGYCLEGQSALCPPVLKDIP